MSNPKNPLNTDANFWKKAWDANHIGFHMKNINPTLEKHLESLTAKKSDLKILFPLCGKAIDMAWLASLGHTVIGIEFVQEAVEQFFQEQNIKYSVKVVDEFKLFTSEDGKLRIYNGDFFKFTNKYEPLLDCCWDRGGLVALPEQLRKQYGPHIVTLLDLDYRYLLVTYKYNPEAYGGPPHLVLFDELKNLYGATCHIELIDTLPHFDFAKSTIQSSGMPDSLSPKESSTQELVYLLTKLK